MRAFYRVPQADWPLLDLETQEPVVDVPDARLLHESTQYAYLHSATSPNPTLEAMGGEKIADTWLELYGTLSATTRDAIFQADVERTDPETQDPVRLRVAVRDIEPGDTVVATHLIPHAWGAQESVQQQAEVDAALA